MASQGNNYGEPGKKGEKKGYVEQMEALGQQHLPPDKERLQQAYEPGNSTLDPAAGAPNEHQLIWTTRQWMVPINVKISQVLKLDG